LILKKMNIKSCGRYYSQASAFLTASFRFYLTVDTLAVQLPVPLVGPVVAPAKALRAMPGAQ